MMLPERVFLLCVLACDVLIWSFLRKLCHIQRKRVHVDRECEGVSASLRCEETSCHNPKNDKEICNIFLSSPHGNLDGNTENLC